MHLEGEASGVHMVGKKKKMKVAQPRPKKTNKQKSKKPWNKGRKISKTHKQHVYVPREQLELFFSVALWFAGPAYCFAIWLCLVTSRRISETLLLRLGDIKENGGPDHDEPHIIYIQREEDDGIQGNGKLGGERVVARISQDAVETLQKLKAEGLHRTVLPVLEPYQTCHPDVFQMKPLQKKPFYLDGEDDRFMFPAQSTKKGCRPNIARQSINKALDKIRAVMHSFTQQRRWNPSEKCRGNRVTVHGATRHTSAALLLFPQHGHAKPPSDSVIMEIQQRSDYRVFREHYFHCDEREVKEGLEFATAPSPFFKRNFSAEPSPPKQKDKQLSLEGEASGSDQKKSLEGEASGSDQKKSLEGEASGSDKKNSLEGEASGSDRKNRLEGEVSNSNPKKKGNAPSCPGPPEVSVAAPLMPAKNPGTSSAGAQEMPSAIPSSAKPFCSRNVSQLLF